jgi:hypothetical protein
MILDLAGGATAAEHPLTEARLIAPGRRETYTTIAEPRRCGGLRQHRPA